MIFLKEIVKAYYDLDIDEITAISIPEGYNELYKIKTTSNAYFALKVHLDQFVNVNQIEEQALFKRHLALNKIPAIPYISTIEYKHSIRVKENLITLEPWRERKAIEGDDFKYLKSLQKIMARMHRVSMDSQVVQVYSGTRWRLFGDNSTNSLYDYDEIALKFKELLTLYPDLEPAYVDLMEKLRPFWDRLPGGVVHGDLSLDNCAFNQEMMVIAIYDFNLMGLDKFVNEMVQSTLLNVFYNRLEGVSYERGLIEFAQLIRIYEEERPLNEDETLALPLIFRLSFIGHFGFKLPKEIVFSVLLGDFDGVVQAL